MLISTKKDAEHISVNTKSYFPTTQMNGFTCMSEATIPSFVSYSCSEHFWKYQWKSPYVTNDCMPLETTFNWI